MNEHLQHVLDQIQEEVDIYENRKENWEECATQLRFLVKEYARFGGEENSSVTCAKSIVREHFGFVR